MAAALFKVAGTNAFVVLAIATGVRHPADTGKALNQQERCSPGGSVDETSLVRAVFERTPVSRFDWAGDAIVFNEAPNVAVYLTV